MTPEARRSTVATIKDWQRRCNSGRGSRAKSTKTTLSDSQFILSEIASGKQYAAGFVFDCVQADGFEDVTIEEVQRVAFEMLHPEAVLEAEYRDAAETERDLRAGMHW